MTIHKKLRNCQSQPKSAQIANSVKHIKSECTIITRRVKMTHQLNFNLFPNHNYGKWKIVGKRNCKNSRFLK